MTIKEANQLISKLNSEIQNGIDVEFNRNWVRLLKQQVAKAIPRGVEEAMQKLKTQGLI
jgi:hypothetical protein